MSNLESSKHSEEATPIAKPKEEVCQDSRIDAPRVFSEKEIVDAIQGTLKGGSASAKETKDETGLIAKIRNFLREIFSEEPSKSEKGPKSPLKISRIIRDKDGNIVALNATAPSVGGKNIEIAYILQGKHGRNQSLGTTIMHTGQGGGDVVAEFKGNQWVQNQK